MDLGRRRQRLNLRRGSLWNARHTRAAKHPRQPPGSVELGRCRRQSLAFQRQRAGRQWQHRPSQRPLAIHPAERSVQPSAAGRGLFHRPCRSRSHHSAWPERLNHRDTHSAQRVRFRGEPWLLRPARRSLMHFYSSVGNAGRLARFHHAHHLHLNGSRELAPQLAPVYLGWWSSRPAGYRSLLLYPQTPLAASRPAPLCRRFAWRSHGLRQSDARQSHPARHYLDRHRNRAIRSAHPLRNSNPHNQLTKSRRLPNRAAPSFPFTEQSPHSLPGFPVR
jgi:hypothetical protein